MRTNCIYIQFAQFVPHVPAMDPSSSRIGIARLIRSCRSTHIVDESGAEPAGVAIYTLSDPRDVREVRYVGQTRSPRQRFSQHMNTARLWLPDELPWWVARPQLRPLYRWIRELFQDERRLPMMFVVAWTEAQHARTAERIHICEHLGRQLPLLNREAETPQRMLT
jgi:hypothetical protein